MFRFLPRSFGSEAGLYESSYRPSSMPGSLPTLPQAPCGCLRIYCLVCAFNVLEHV